MTASQPSIHGARHGGVRLFRAGLLVAFVLVLRFHNGGGVPLQSELGLGDVLPLFPTAFSLRAGKDVTAVESEDGAVLGYAVKTLPVSKAIIGYAGPSDVLIGLDEDGTVTTTTLLWSGDTKEHLEAIHKAPSFFEAFAGWHFGGENDPKAIDAVSGATLTSLAIIQSVSLRLGGDTPSLKFPEPVALRDVQRLFPGATTIDERNDDDPYQAVRDEGGTVLGTVVRTAPHADAIMGYQGPSDALIGFSPEKTVVGITMGATFESQRYADYVREDDYFTERHAGKTVAELAEVVGSRAWGDGVSGATMTSGAVMEGVVRRAKLLAAPPEPPKQTRQPFTFRLRDGATVAAILFACVVAFTRFRANRYLRFALHAYLVLILGLWVGDMVSLAVLGGWSTGAIPWRSAPGLVALVGLAFALPWATGKPVYCQQLCPHGAAQSLLFRWVPGRIRVRGRVHRVLGAVPFICVAVGLAVLLLDVPVSLSELEPFDAWIFGVGGLATLLIAVVGLAASAFIPQAYCKYGCPTGLILDYARTRRHEKSLNRRDLAATLLLIVAWVMGYAPSF